MSRTYWLFAVVIATASLVGCANALPADGAGSPTTTLSATTSQTNLDGRSFHLSVSAERGGAPERLDIAFANGRINASDGSELGYTPAPYAVREAAASSSGSVEFQAETRSPTSVRRFKGRVVGTRIEGTLMLVPHGAAPTFYSFGGEST